MNAAAETHLAAATSFIAIAEAADSSSVAYRKAAEEIDKAMKADPTLTQRAVAKDIGKSQQYVGVLLKALTSALVTGVFDVDWRSGSNKRADLERRIPKRQEDKIAMASTLLADPEVAAKAVEKALATPSKASRLIENTVAKKGAERRKKAMQAAQHQREDGALPLPAYMSSMVMKMTEFEVGMKALEDDLDDLPEGRGRELVGEAARRLGDTAYRWADRLERRPVVLSVIEGRKVG